MTDYAEPTTPQEVCKRLAHEFETIAKRKRLEAQVLTKQAEAFDACADECMNEADRYDSYYPKAADV